MLRLLLIRHGRSEMNAQGRIQGWLDSPLDDLGRVQAHAVAGRLQREGLALLYSSDLRRAWETAQIIGQTLDIPLIPDVRLRERNLGDIAGLSGEEVQERFPDMVREWEGSRMMRPAPGGEQPADFWARVVAAFDDIVARHPEGTVGVVTHGGVLAAYMSHLMGLEVGRWGLLSFGNGSLSAVELTERGARIRWVNDCCHLDGVALSQAAEPACGVEESSLSGGKRCTG